MRPQTERMTSNGLQHEGCRHDPAMKGRESSKGLFGAAEDTHASRRFTGAVTFPTPSPRTIAGRNSRFSGKKQRKRIDHFPVRVVAPSRRDCPPFEDQGRPGAGARAHRCPAWRSMTVQDPGGRALRSTVCRQTDGAERRMHRPSAGGHRHTFGEGGVFNTRLCMYCTVAAPRPTAGSAPSPPPPLCLDRSRQFRE